MIHGIVLKANQYHVPVIAICGNQKMNIDELKESGLLAAFSITDRAMSLEESIEEASLNIEKIIYNIMHLIK